jgi:hypothetical protein
MSALKLERIDYDAPGGIEIHLGGVDLMDGTPVLDIKPYLPYADSIPEAGAGWAEGEIPRFAVNFSEEAGRVLESARDRYPRLRELVTQMLEWDPRPTSQRRTMAIDDPASEGLSFGFRVQDYDIQWEIRERAILVTRVISVCRT